MKILFLGPFNNNIVDFLYECGEELIHYEEKIYNKDDEILKYIDFVISFGYRYKLPVDVVELFKDKIINLHISLLPWNRGSDPNLWSFLEDTPKGITIHYMDKNIDAGKIIIQKEIKFFEEKTLRTTYERLKEEIEKMFNDNWFLIKGGMLKGFKPKGQGTYHKASDKNPYLYLLKDGWDTRVEKLIGKVCDK